MTLLTLKKLGPAFQAQTTTEDEFYEMYDLVFKRSYEDSFRRGKYEMELDRAIRELEQKIKISKRGNTNGQEGTHSALC